MAGAQFVLLALRFFRCIASDSLELRGTARLLSTVLAARLVAARRAARRSARIVLPLAGRTAGRRPACAGSCWRLRSRSRSAARSWAAISFFVSVVPKHLAAPYIAIGKRGRMTLKRLLGLDTRADRYAYAVDPVAGYISAQKVPDMGRDDLRVLLGRLRHVHRRQGRTRGQGARQPRSPGQPRHALPEGAVRAPHDRRRQPRPLSARCDKNGERVPRQLGRGADDDGGAVPGDAGAVRARRRGRHQHRPARHRGVLRARQARTARDRHAQHRRQHDALHVDRRVGLQAIVRQRRPTGRVRGSRARRRHHPDRRQHRREPSDSLLAAAGQSRTAR